MDNNQDRITCRMLLGGASAAWRSTVDITGSLPIDNHSRIACGADRSGFLRLATLSIPASMAAVGNVTIMFTRGTGTTGGTGLVWDTASLPSGATATPQSTVDLTDAPYFFESDMEISFSAHGGRSRTTVIGH
ncbi:hypothetical protein BDK92_7451 [Micromonospora pisi]|uniref:Uncharacterized protein n=1 Tax=Micromonospora pisi TaxID=589240 RepID=A0A495JVD0_9ACTN|nr:hypothetical protein [Micromonospora pisi]RKR92960.1 hypothetical protein BDK92_7451 [Micromonospora pisi]